MRKERRPCLLLMTTLLLTVAAARSSARAQGADADWQTLNPEREEFTILMPKDAKFEESTEPYHRDMTLNTRLYLSNPAKGPVLAVVSLSGIKAAGPNSEFLRLNSYVDAFKNWFPQKVRGKEAIARLTLLGEKTLNGNLGREYRVVIGDLSGTARVFATRRRFYAAVVLNTKKDDELTEQFLSSFMLPEKMVPPTVQQPTVVAGNAQAAPANAIRKPGDNPEDGQKPETATDAGAEAKPVEPDAAPAKKPGERAPINGGILNGKAISLPQPEYPAIAEQAKAVGAVTVQVLVDETGQVISAHATSGHPLLQAASVAAARQAKFAPTSLMGEPVKVSGVLTYNFASR